MFYKFEKSNERKKSPNTILHGKCPTDTNLAILIL